MATSAAASSPPAHGSGVTVTRRGLMRRDQSPNRECRGSRRTARITRSSRRGLTRTGFRSSPAIRSILRSSLSDIVHLAQQLTEAVAGAHDTHLQRRHTYTRELRHLVVTQLFHVLQQEGLPLFRT